MGQRIGRGLGRVVNLVAYGVGCGLSDIINLMGGSLRSRLSDMTSVASSRFGDIVYLVSYGFGNIIRLAGNLVSHLLSAFAKTLAYRSQSMANGGAQELRPAFPNGNPADFLGCARHTLITGGGRLVVDLRRYIGDANRYARGGNCNRHGYLRCSNRVASDKPTYSATGTKNRAMDCVADLSHLVHSGSYGSRRRGRNRRPPMTASGRCSVPTAHG